MTAPPIAAGRSWRIGFTGPQGAGVLRRVLHRVRRVRLDRPACLDHRAVSPPPDPLAFHRRQPVLPSERLPIR